MTYSKLSKQNVLNQKLAFYRFFRNSYLLKSFEVHCQCARNVTIEFFKSVKLKRFSNVI